MNSRRISEGPSENLIPIEKHLEELFPIKGPNKTFCSVEDILSRLVSYARPSKGVFS